MRPEENWTLISDRILHDGYRKVRERRFRLPSGKEQAFEITETPDVVCALALNNAGQLILTRQFRPGPGRILLVPPGGIIDPGEDPDAAMQRELQEETGFMGRLVSLHTGVQSAYTTGRRHHYLALECEQVAHGPSDPDEVAGVELRSAADIPALLAAGALADLETIFAGLAALAKNEAPELTIFKHLFHGKELFP